MGEWPYKFYVLANHFIFPMIIVLTVACNILKKNAKGMASNLFGIQLTNTFDFRTFQDIPRIVVIYTIDKSRIFGTKF